LHRLSGSLLVFSCKLEACYPFRPKSLSKRFSGMFPFSSSTQEKFDRTVLAHP
jgi:hypothetical protein